MAPRAKDGTLVLIDGDIVAYQTCNSAGLDSLPLLKHAVSKTLNGYLEYLNAHFNDVRFIEIHLTGSTNYRHDVGVSVPYKGNRVGKEKPFGFYEIRDYLKERHYAVESVNEEADDAISIKACSQPDPTKVVIVSPDKDLRIVPVYVWDGNVDHPIQLGIDPGYLQYQRRRGYTQVVGCGLKFFYWQLLMGDTADHIKRPWRYKSGEPMALYRQLQLCNNESDLYKIVLGVYTDKGSSKERLIENGQLLWLRRKPGEMWQPPQS